jgi:hypothetical protein
MFSNQREKREAIAREDAKHARKTVLVKSFLKRPNARLIKRENDGITFSFLYIKTETIRFIKGIEQSYPCDKVGFFTTHDAMLLNPKTSRGITIEDIKYCFQHYREDFLGGYASLVKIFETRMTPGLIKAWNNGHIANAHIINPLELSKVPLGALCEAKIHHFAVMEPSLKGVPDIPELSLDLSAYCLDTWNFEGDCPTIAIESLKIIKERKIPLNNSFFRKFARLFY